MNFNDTKEIKTAYRTVQNLSLAFRMLFKPRFKYINSCVDCTNAFKIVTGISLISDGMFKNDMYAVNAAINAPDYYFVNTETNSSISYHDVFGYEFTEQLANKFDADLRFFTSLHDELVASIRIKKQIENYKIIILLNTFGRLISYYNFNLKRDVRLPDKGETLLSLWNMRIPTELITVHRFMYLITKIGSNFASPKIVERLNDIWPELYSESLCAYVINEHHLILYTRIPLTFYREDRKQFNRSITKFDYYSSKQPFSELLQYSQVINQLLLWVCLLVLYLVLVRRRYVRSLFLRAAIVIVIPGVYASPPQEMYYGTFTIFSTVSILFIGILLVLFVTCCCRLPTYLITYFGRVRRSIHERSVLSNYVLRLGIYLPYIRILERHEQEIYIDMPLESVEPVPFNTKYVRLNGNLHLWAIRERGPSLRLECISLIEFEACRPDGQVISVLKHCVSIPLNSIEWHKNNVPLGFEENECGLGVVELLVRKTNNESHYETPIGKTYMKTTEI